MINQENLLTISPQKFIDFLRAENISRFFLVYAPDTHRLIASHTQLQALADYFSADKRDFMRHEGIFVQISKKNDTLLGAFVHRTKRGQAAKA